MNFNTTNMTFRQLMGNGLSYRVPQFQRDYSWDADEWDDLWLDIVGLFGDEPEPAHYMGYLVLQSADSRSFDIIDGQQRMTTLSLLMLAAVSHLNDLAAPDVPEDPQYRRSQQLRGNYIGYLDPVSLVPRSKLTLNRHNDRFYQNYLVPLERLPQRGLNASEHLLRRAFNSFKGRIRDHCGEDGESVARFVDGAVDKLFFTVITVTDELNAFKVFETLNARGVRLSATDLLKNYFKLEEKLSGNSFEFESAKYDIEHVLPENPDDDWGQFDEQQRDASTHRLGNMTLLESARNRELGNKGFADKRRVFGESEFAITKRLAQEFDSWTTERIRSRQGWMAKQATGIWQVGF